MGALWEVPGEGEGGRYPPNPPVELLRLISFTIHGNGMEFESLLLENLTFFFSLSLFIFSSFFLF